MKQCHIISIYHKRRGIRNSLINRNSKTSLYIILHFKHMCVKRNCKCKVLNCQQRLQCFFWYFSVYQLVIIICYPDKIFTIHKALLTARWNVLVVFVFIDVIFPIPLTTVLIQRSPIIGLEAPCPTCWRISS